MNKWNDPSVPKRGWKCDDVEDLGAGKYQTCAMCDRAHIRFVHLMAHPDHDGMIEAGCVCAGYMEGDHEAPELREKRAKSIAAKRKRWLKRTWNRSEKGNIWLKAHGTHVTIFRSGDGFKACIAPDGHKPVYSKVVHPTAYDAKWSAFYAMAKWGLV